MDKYHTMLASIFERALVDRVVTFNPCAHTELPKHRQEEQPHPDPAEYDAILAALPAQHRLMVETAINTGVRWGELIALKPRHLDLTTGRLTVEETIVEVSSKHSPTGERMLTKPYPKDNEPRTMALPEDLIDPLADLDHPARLGPDDLLFATRQGTPISRNTFRTRVWLPAVAASGVAFDVRVHDLRHAHASWLLAGGSDLKSVMDRMGTPRSPPPRSTCTPSPTPTPRTSPPSTASATPTPNRHPSPHCFDTEPITTLQPHQQARMDTNRPGSSRSNKPTVTSKTAPRCRRRLDRGEERPPMSDCGCSGGRIGMRPRN